MVHIACLKQARAHRAARVYCQVKRQEASPPPSIASTAPCHMRALPHVVQTCFSPGYRLARTCSVPSKLMLQYAGDCPSLSPNPQLSQHSSLVNV